MRISTPTHAGMIPRPGPDGATVARPNPNQPRDGSGLKPRPKPINSTNGK